MDVPLAMPMLSGPGSIALVSGLTSQSTSAPDYLAVSLAIVLVSLSTFGLLIISRRLMQFMGRSGMTTLTRMMGFIALTIGLQFIINGIRPIIGT